MVYREGGDDLASKNVPSSAALRGIVSVDDREFEEVFDAEFSAVVRSVFVVCQDRPSVTSGPASPGRTTQPAGSTD